MSAEQYDVTPQQKRILEEKAKRRLFLRNEFLKLRTDPFQHATGEGGTVFDPAIYRYNAMKVSQYEYFRPTGRNGIIGLGLLVLPMLGFGLLIKWDRDTREASYRRGEVAYKDRNWKWAS